MAIQLRKGLASDLDKSKLLPGEIAVPTTGRPQLCRKVNDVIGLLTTDDEPTMDALIARMIQLETDLQTLIAQKVGINDTTASTTQAYSSSKTKSLVDELNNNLATKTLMQKSGQSPDFNLVTEIGIYNVNSWAVTFTNIPVTEKGNDILEVIRISNTIVQKFYQTATNNIFTRTWIDGANTPPGWTSMQAEYKPTILTSSAYQTGFFAVQPNTWTDMPISLVLPVGYSGDLTFAFINISDTANVSIVLKCDGAIRSQYDITAHKNNAAKINILNELNNGVTNTFRFEIYSQTQINIKWMTGTIKRYKNS